MWKKGEHDEPTNDGCWKATNDNRLPNPPLEIEAEIKTHKESDKLTTKIRNIMEYEFEEYPESFQAVKQEIADSYNKAHTIQPGKPFPEQKQYSNWDPNKEAGPVTGFEELERRKKNG